MGQMSHGTVRIVFVIANTSKSMGCVGHVTFIVLTMDKTAFVTGVTLAIEINAILAMHHVACVQDQRPISA